VIIALCLVLFGAGATFGFALSYSRSKEQMGESLAELRGWLRCERAVFEEARPAERRGLLRRVRTRVPPGLRLDHERLLVDAEQAADATSSARLR
jgi:hypothetical protein